MEAREKYERSILFKTSILFIASRGRALTWPRPRWRARRWTRWRMRVGKHHQAQCFQSLLAEQTSAQVPLVGIASVIALIARRNTKATDNNAISVVLFDALKRF